MKKLGFLLMLMIIKSTLYAQLQMTLQLVDIKGMSVEDKKYTDVVGDQYLHTDWVDGTITFKSNQNVDAPLKFDAYNNLLLFKNVEGKELQPKNEVKGFTLNLFDKEVSDFNRLTFLKGFPPIGKQTENTYYQLIADGPVKLLKLQRKKIQEQSTFTSGVVTKTFKLYQTFFLVMNDKIIEIDPGKKSFRKVLTSHSAEIDTYFKNHSVNFNSDIDLRNFFLWYNALS